MQFIRAVIIGTVLSHRLMPALNRDKLATLRVGMISLLMKAELLCLFFLKH